MQNQIAGAGGGAASILADIARRNPNAFAGNWQQGWGNWRNVGWQNMTKDQQAARVADDQSWRQSMARLPVNRPAVQGIPGNPGAGPGNPYQMGGPNTGTGVVGRGRQYGQQPITMAAIIEYLSKNKRPGGFQGPDTNFGNNSNMSGNFAISHPEVAAALFGKDMAASLASLGLGDGSGGLPGGAVAGDPGTGPAGLVGAVGPGGW